MIPRFRALSALSLLWIAAALPLRAAPEPPARNIVHINGIPDTSSYWLRDTVVLGRVNGRPLRVREFIDTYYDSYAEDRPDGDSLGRVQWLNSMINKAILGTVARQANYPFGFEERQAMREHTERVLSNVLFQRAVLESVKVDEKEIRERYELLKTEYHLRHILFADSALAGRIRSDLGAGRITWKDAAAKYSTAVNDSGPEGDLGWLGQAVDFDEPRIFNLGPGQISPVLPDPAGFQIVQLLARRAVEPPAWEGARSFIGNQLGLRQVRLRSERLVTILRAQSGMQYDDANIRWAASQFPPERRSDVDLAVRFGGVLPVFTPADTARALAQWRDGRLSLGAFVAAYSNLPPTHRPNIHSRESFINQVDAFVLEPYKARMAVERKLDQDSLALAMIDKKREQLLVEHLYRDSVEARISVDAAQRRKYYERHLAQYMTFPSVRYALLVRSDSVSAQALAARLRSGEKAEDIQRADSLAGLPSRLRADSEGRPGAFHALLFNELKPGKVAVQGPDEKGQYAVIQSLAYDAGRQLSFAESQGYVDESLRSEKAEELFMKLVTRQRRTFKIESHPELVMRIKLVDPVAGLN